MQLLKRYDILIIFSNSSIRLHTNINMNVTTPSLKKKVTKFRDDYII
jgi:hypothetical protein